jgi:hypothetical protein
MLPNEGHRFYGIAGFAVQIEAGLLIDNLSFHPQLERFRIPRIPAVSNSNTVTLRHHFSLPNLSSFNLDWKVYDRSPWEIYRAGSSWIYVGKPIVDNPFIVAVFNDDHSAADIYHPNLDHFRSKKLDALSLFPTDQLWLARLLANRDAFLLHAAGLVIEGHGLAFVGHSEAGKTTISRLLQDKGEILCDDRIILRRWPEGFKVHGTWSHGELPDVSPNSAPLRAVFLLEQAPENRLIRLEPREVVRALPQFVIKPLVTRDWWEQVLDTIGALARAVPVYRLRFDKSGRVWELLQELL